MVMMYTENKRYNDMKWLTCATNCLTLEQSIYIVFVAYTQFMHKIKFLSFTHPYVVPNLYEFLMLSTKNFFF